MSERRYEMKVLLINGSPNEKGCTHRALLEVADTLEKNGIETEIVSIGKKAVSGCIGCGGCAKNNHRCVFQNDITNEIVEKFEKADGFVVGSPTYFMSPNGSLIALLDRMFMTGVSCRMKPAAAVTSARRGGTTSTLDVIYKYFLMNEMPVVSSNYANMVHGHEPAEVEQDLEGLQTMRSIGSNMAWLLKCIDAGKKAGIADPEKEAKVKTSYIR